MIDSYNSYLSRSVQAQTTLQQCQNKIAYFLQVKYFNKIRIINKNIFVFVDSNGIYSTRNY
jgi:hypothetical protein